MNLTESPLSEMGAYKAALLLPKVVLPILIVVGVVGNLLTLVTLHSRAYGRSPSTVGLTFLAVADTGYLISTLRWWANAVFHADFRLISSAACSFHQMWTYYFRHLSSWTLAFVTVERAVCVCFPIRWKTTFTTRRNAAILGCMALVLFGINLQIPFKFGFNWDSDSNITYCNVYISQDYWYNKVWVPLDEVLHFFLPATIILTGNIVIIWRLRSEPLNADVNEERNKSITVMLVAVSIVFLLTILPNAIFRLGDAERAWSEDTNQEIAEVTLAYYVTTMWARVNNAINFLLYCATGSKFIFAFFQTFRVLRQRIKVGHSSGSSHEIPSKLSISQGTVDTHV